MYGLSDEEIAAIRAGQLDGFAPPEVTLLRMADAMADTPSNVSDELYAELRQHFSEEQLNPKVQARPFIHAATYLKQPRRMKLPG